MTRFRVLITAPFDPQVAEELSRHVDVDLATPSLSGASLARGEHKARLTEAHVVICELDVVDEESLAAIPELGLVVACRAAPVNVDLQACGRRGVQVATTPGRNADAAADLTMALLLATVRHTFEAERWLRKGSWNADDPFAPYSIFRGMSLNGHTIGIIGGGAVGRRVATRAAAFGMTVLVHDPHLSAGAFDTLAELVELDDLLRRSDVVSLHVSLSEATKGLLGARELELMRPDAYLINAGQAALIDEEPLVDALREGRLAGAGFDVYWHEPIPKDHPLLALRNVTLTPHIGGASDDVVSAHSRMAADAVLEWVAGRTPPHTVAAPGPVPA